MPTPQPRTSERPPALDRLWWRDGVIYQIYPRSFADSNGDGLGDLPGITRRLDYLAELNVDAIWLSPFYPSPDKDFGYDISDYCNVDPRFGCLEDFDHLVAEAHRRGIRIILDMVLNHTSDQHPWFLESRSSRANPKRDWYIWRDAPNNWAASFGGGAWSRDLASGQFYLHLFTPEQPDLNWRNPEVRQAMLDVFRFWLARGTDGFRLDVFNAYFKHPDMPDNPPRPGLVAFERQDHVYEMDQPEMVPFLQELRHLLDSYPERYAVGETYLATPEKILRYCGEDRLHAAFSFDLSNFESKLNMVTGLYPWGADWVRQKISQREAAFNPAGIWSTLVMSNHDLPRAASRYSRGEEDHQAKLVMALLLTLCGTPFIYYGEEIGMRDLDLKRSEIMDPPGKKYWPLYKGRDGCRTPMQWDGTAGAGFSTARPWLRLHPNAARRNVAAQKQDPTSLWHFTRALIALRRATPALQRGDLLFLDGQRRHVLAYTRSAGEQSVLVALNFSRKEQALALPDGDWQGIFPEAMKEAPRSIPPWGVVILTKGGAVRTEPGVQ